MPAPTTPVLTNFTGANEDPLSEGGNWTAMIRPVSVPNIGNCERASNKADESAGVIVAGSRAWFESFAGPQEAYATISDLPDSDESVGVWARVHDPGVAGTAEGYVFSYRPDTGIQLRRYTVGATFTLIGTDEAVTLAQNDKLFILCNGTSIAGYYFTSGAWVLGPNGTDSAITGSGQIGISVGAGAGSLDDFGGGTAVAAAAGRRFKRLYGPAHIGTSPVTLYTAPASTRSVMRRIWVSNPSGSPVDFTFSIGADAAATRVRWDSYNVPANGELEWAYDEALAAGEFIQAFAGAGSTLVVVIDGYEQAV